MSFQDNLRMYRERLGINAKDFAAQLGIKYTTYAGYENQGKEPKYETLCKIAAALHVSLDDLMDYKPDRLQYWLNKLNTMQIESVLHEEDEHIELYYEGLHAVFTIKEFIETMEGIEKESYELVNEVREGVFTLKVRDKIRENSEQALTKMIIDFGKGIKSKKK